MIVFIVGCIGIVCFFFFFKQKTAYEMRISDWSSDVCSSDLLLQTNSARALFLAHARLATKRWSIGRGCPASPSDRKAYQMCHARLATRNSRSCSVKMEP